MSQSSKKYRWNPETRTAQVIHGSRPYDLPKHSPSMHFACGDCSDESLHLALSIMQDLLGCKGKAARWSIYFMGDLIAEQNARFHWEISEEQIRFWMAAVRTRKATAA